MEINREKIEKIAKKYNLELMVLFGSQATGQTHSRSDVDLGVISKRLIN